MLVLDSVRKVFFGGMASGAGTTVKASSKTSETPMTHGGKSLNTFGGKSRDTMV